jgi:FKBP-type peptidyl-prolyl cis-trans isomerase FklB
MKTAVIAVAAIFAFGLSACNSEVSKKDLTGQKEKISYGYGLNVGRNLKTQEVELDLKVFMKGVKDGMSGDTTVLLTDAELREAFQSYMKELNQKKMDKAKAQADENKKAGAKFLEENKTKEGVVTLPSGLQYKALEEGSGASPKLTDVVTFHYTGKLLDGKVFDSSVGGAPAESPITNLIKGWQEALVLMKPGSKWELYIPSDLAYGDRGAGDIIEPGSTLVFEVELISFKKAK